MTVPANQPERLRVAHLNPRAPTPFSLTPDAHRCAAIAAELGISALSRLTFAGEIRAEAGEAWALTGRLCAHVTQPCVVTLKPVKTRLEETVERASSPDPFQTSQLQPLPKRVTPFCTIVCLRSAKLPNAEPIASASAPLGSPPPFGPMFSQKMT